MTAIVLYKRTRKIILCRGVVCIAATHPLMAAYSTYSLRFYVRKQPPECKLGSSTAPKPPRVEFPHRGMSEVDEKMYTT
ncbi:hypothetical protein BDZ94DRAFT_512174 [Collybia nuda]|uniref:Uncharacterized protein n=1 Tax=Collybia nuda TaxID=64659 RepID=A0A9P6C854_9AGAR|nr:hypothetical protein BDZ94DRAFT_512174 [Collybia nuda]